MAEARARLLIRKPVAEVFEAFVDPDITSKFWFTHSTGRLCEAQRVRWEWRMFGVSTDVNVLELEQDERLLMEWGSPGKTTTVEWTFQSGPKGTNVVVEQRGFDGDPSQRVAAAVESTEGFTLVLAGAKAWLEHGLRLNLIVDRHPDAVNSAAHVG